MLHHNILVPPINYDERISRSPNIFRDAFGMLGDAQWCDLLIQSIDRASIDGIEFPRYPDESLQNRIHGHSAAHSLREALTFYLFIKHIDFASRNLGSSKRFLDFGAGWGRILRLFMRDFDLKDLYAYEPNLMLCAISRALNPYVCMLTGDFVPTGCLPKSFFNLIVGWSVFSHLSELAAEDWLEELSTILVRDGCCAFTTWGERFLLRLIREKAALDMGEDIHWYSRICIEAAGDLDVQLAQYRAGEFVWFTSGRSLLYGEAFLGYDALCRIIHRKELPFDVVVFDSTTLAQDVFVLRKR